MPMPGTDYDWDAPVKLTTARRQRLDGAAALRPRPGAGAGRRHATSTAAQQQSKLTSAWYQLPAARRRPPAGGGHRRGHHHRQQRAQRRAPTARPSNWSTRRRVPTAHRCRPAGSRPYDIGPTPSWRNLRFARVADPRRRDRGPGRRRGSLADAGRLDRRHPAAGARAALGAGVRRLAAAGADGLGGRAGVPVPAADAARQRRHRGARSSGSRRTTTPSCRTPTPGRTASTAACSASPICCCGRT